MIRGIIFDMDGLMFDTERLVVKALTEIGAEEGLDIDMDLIMSCIGVNEKSCEALFKAKFGQDFDYAHITRKRIDRVAELIRRDGIPVKKGLKELLAYAKEQGYAVTVATSTTQDKARWYFRMAGIDDCFSRIVSGDMVTHSKPHPEPFLRAAELLHLKPGECLALEDSFNGIRAAHGAQMPVVMVPDLKQPDEEIRGLASYVREDLSQVIPILAADAEKSGGPKARKRLRILCVADEEEPCLWERFDPRIVEGVDLILACGDLKAEYLDFLVTMVPVPLFFVCGNHDRDKPLPSGCEHIDGRLVTFKGVRIVGFDGCKSHAPFQYHFSERQMDGKIRRLYWPLRRARGFDILVSHAGPLGLGDGPDEYHMGFASLRRLIDLYKPAYAVHGHTHLNYGRVDRMVDYHGTQVVNAYGYTIIEI